MRKLDFLKQARLTVKHLEKKKKDPRYTRIIGFLVGKGFLHANRALLTVPNIRINIEDAIWAGRNVEPRILEVLPAAVIRLEKHFDYNPEVHLELKRAIEQLKGNGEGDFFGVPTEKMRPWLYIRLKDKRTKSFDERKVTKTFRLSPNAIERLRHLKREMNISEAELLEKLLLGALAPQQSKPK